MIREQQRQVSKVLLDGLYDPDSELSILLGAHHVVMETVWQKLVENWQIFPSDQQLGRKPFLRLRGEIENQVTISKIAKFFRNHFPF